MDTTTIRGRGTLRRQVPVVLVAAIGTTLSAACWGLALRWERQEIHQSFEWTARERIVAVELGLEQMIDSLYAVRSFVRSSQQIEPHEFREFTAPFLSRTPGLETLALGIRVPRAGRTRFEKELREEHPALQIREPREDRVLVRAPDREQHLVIRRVEPVSAHGGALGLDLAWNPSAVEALLRAHDTNEVGLTTPLEFPIGEEPEIGFLAFLPIYTTRENIESGETLGDFVMGFVRLGAILSSRPTGASEGPTIRIHLFAHPVGASDVLLFSDVPGVRERSDIRDSMLLERSLHLGSRDWTLLATSDPDTWPTQLAWIPWAVVAAGLVVTGVLAAYLRANRDRQAEIEELVRERTKQLSQSNLALETESLERRRAESILRDREEHLAGILANVWDGIVTFDESGCIESFNSAAERIFGYRPDEVRVERIQALLGEVDGRALAEDLDYHVQTAQDGIIGKGIRELVAQRKDGSTFTAEAVFSEMRLAQRRLFVACIRDVSERKEAERQLQQAQRMDAIGQLTGGVAHDFNNLLTVIHGNLEILARRSGEESNLRKPIETALRATRRGADLTQRLLAFSRRQPLHPTSVDVNDLVTGTVELMKRTLDSSIQIETRLANDLWPALTDPSQLENALINLAVNSRDAMPNGGRLTLETGNVVLESDYAARNYEVRPGPYVMIAVTDTGVGMPPDVVRRAFDPFFTTKEAGKGTGLGLSMVHGFLKQSGGHVQIYSEEGHGTTIRLYCPKAPRGAEASHERPGRALERRARSEKVLVVEDNPDVREIAVSVLQELGYRVLEASSAREALVVLDENADIDVLLTDIVMPGGMSGRDLGSEALRRNPTLPVIYCSGYSEYAVFRDGQLGPRERFLVKPYTGEALAAILEDLLASEVSA